MIWLSPCKIGVGPCDRTFSGSVSLSPCCAFHVIVYMHYSRSAARYSVGWTGGAKVPGTIN